MHRCWSLFLLAVCVGWTLLVARGAGAVDRASDANGADPGSTGGGREAPVWRPQRPQSEACDRLGLARPMVSETPLAPVSPTKETPAKRELFGEGPELMLPGGGVCPEPFHQGNPVNDHRSPGTAGYGVEWLDPALGAGFPSGEFVYHGVFAGTPGNLLLFAGVHGFKGPTDLGLSGNFGFHEGLNWGAPLGDPWGYGYQVGFQALHSNFAGNQTLPGPLPSFDTADRNQVFFTAGFFRRPQGDGLQAGTAFDLFYDNYYHRSTLCQIRSETALVLGGLHEIGYWGAYGVSQETVSGLGQFDSVLDPTDMFAVFYRRRFTGGGQGRLWTGLSGDGDLILGLDGTVPLGTSWALDNNFTCLFPKHGRSTGAAPEESWSVSIHLVWYAGRPARQAIRDPYHPLFYVADNSWFLVDRRR